MTDESADPAGEGSGRPLTFSQRHGLAPVPPAVQLHDLDERTRTDLWNVLHIMVVRADSRIYEPLLVWCRVLGERADHFTERGFGHAVERKVFREHWHDLYSFMEMLASIMPDGEEEWLDILNAALADNRAGHRIVGTQIVPITNDTELEAIGQVLAQPADSLARRHLVKALRLLGDRESPQYSNSIKESISAVEAAARELSERSTATLGEALDIIAKQGTPIHPALLKGWKSIYGFTSDGAGIRHAETGTGVPATLELAQYFLITCSAMVNYLAFGAASAPPETLEGA